MAELPQNWQKEYLTNICNVYQPKTISTKELLADGSYPVYGANGQIGYYDKYNHEFSEVLITCRGATCGNINKSVPKSWINGNAMVASPISNAILDKNYLFYYLKNTSFDDYISGTAQPQITRTSLTKMPVIYPPLNEQKRIVEKLDKIMRIVDDVNERLNKIPTALKRARQSILNQAITGELTKDWREKENIEISLIPKNIYELGDLLCGTSPKSSETNVLREGIPYVSGPEQWDGKEIIVNKWTKYPKKIAPNNSIFITVKGAGVGKIFPGINAAIGRDIYAFVPNETINYSFLMLYLQNMTLEIINKAQGLIPGISKKHILQNTILLPPLEEQAEIVRRVKLAFEKLDKIESRHQKAKEYSDKLTQSILNKAFRGELVPQDPNDSPIKIPE